MGFLTLTADGGFAEQMTCPVYTLYRLPEALDLVIGALVEPLAVGVHAVRTVGVDGADEVAPNLDLVKGWGGALVREGIVAAASRRRSRRAEGSTRAPAARFPARSAPLRRATAFRACAARPRAA